MDVTIFDKDLVNLHSLGIGSSGHVSIFFGDRRHLFVKPEKLKELATFLHNAAEAACPPILSPSEVAALTDQGPQETEEERGKGD